MSQTTSGAQPEPSLDIQSGAVKQPNLERFRGREHLSLRDTRSGTVGLWIAVGVLTVLVLLPPGTIYRLSNLSAKRISLVDDAGRELACFVNSGKGEGLVITRNAQGKDLILLTTTTKGDAIVAINDGNGTSLIELSAHEHGGSIVTRNRAGQPAVGVGAGEGGRGFVALFAEARDPNRTDDKEKAENRESAPHVYLGATKNGGAVEVHTDIGTSAAILGTDKDGVGGLTTFDYGRPLVNLYASSGGDGQFSIKDSLGRERVYIGIRNDSPHIALNSDKGREVVYIGEELEHHGIIRIRDTLGRDKITLNGGVSAGEVVVHNENGEGMVELGAYSFGGSGGGRVSVKNARGDEACLLQSDTEGYGDMTVKGPGQANVSIRTTPAFDVVPRSTGVSIFNEQGNVACMTHVDSTGKCIWIPGR